MYTYASLTSIIFKTEKVKYAKLVTMIRREARETRSHKNTVWQNVKSPKVNR